MECKYTAQGYFVCKKPVIESFTVREDPNEKSVLDYCTPIHNSFLDIAKRHVCDVKADIGTCKFEFACGRPNN